MTKACRKCRVEKPLSEFGKDSRVADGRRATCKSCRNRQLREKRRLAGKRPSPSFVVVNGQKGCSRCGKILPVSHFSVSSRAKSGLQSQCKACDGDCRDQIRERQKRRRFPPFKGYGLPECRGL